MKKRDFIGIFDSGVGGLSVWLEIVRLLPNENTIYIPINPLINNIPEPKPLQAKIFRDVLGCLNGQWREIITYSAISVMFLWIIGQ